MKDLSKRLAALSPKQRALLKARLKAEGLDLDIDNMERVEGISLPQIKPVEEREYHPLSPVQSRLFFLHQLGQTGIAYNAFDTRLVDGRPDKEKMMEVFATLIRRHESLRTSFEYVDSVPVQRIHRQVAFKINYYNLASSTVKNTESDQDVPESQAKIIKDFVRPFDLKRAPLLRVGVIRLTGDRYRLIIDMHHIMSDQASKRILFQEYLRLYRGEGVPEIKIRYRDFVHWRCLSTVQAALEKQAAYWSSELAGPIGLLNLPTDYKRPEQKSYEGDYISFKICPGETARLKAMALSENTTLFVVMLAIYYVFLFKVSRQDDIILGTPVSGRRHPGLDSVIGMFVNTLVIRNRLEGGRTFGHFLKQVAKKTQQAFENQDYEFEDLVKKIAHHRDPGRNPLFDVFFSFTYPDMTLLKPSSPAGVEIEQLQPESGTTGIKASMFDLFFNGAELGDGILMVLIYCTRLFRADTVERFVRYLSQIISIVSEQREIKIQDINISHDLDPASADTFRGEDGEFGF